MGKVEGATRVEVLVDVQIVNFVAIVMHVEAPRWIAFPLRDLAEGVAWGIGGAVEWAVDGVVDSKWNWEI